MTVYSDPRQVNPPQGYDRYRKPAELNIMALLSFIFAMVGIMVNGFSLAAVIMGFIALNQIKKDPNAYTGRGFAIAGIVIGFVKMALMILFIIAYIFIFLMILSVGTY